MNNFGIYVHLPYCKSICPYCDFNSYVEKNPPYEKLTQALIADLKAHRDLFPDVVLRSVYFGGGTPSLAPAHLFAEVLSAIDVLFGLSTATEITAEVNPGTIALPKLKEFHAVGINRISMGWQSTHDNLLKVLGRGHSAKDSEQVFLQTQEAGFKNISADLIFAVPTQTLENLTADLERLTALNPQHISLYALTYHEETPFYDWKASGRIKPAPEELEVAMMDHIEQFLQNKNFDHYEISNYAQPGYKAVHNSLYWQGAQYLGIGPGAHSFCHQQWQQGQRFEAVRDPNAYMQQWLSSDVQKIYAFKEELTSRQLLNERLLCGLRLKEGIDLKLLDNDSFEHYKTEIENKISEALKQKWAVIKNNHLQPTPLGLRFADTLAGLFF